MDIEKQAKENKRKEAWSGIDACWTERLFMRLCC
jgi:hypothetical protein